MNPYPLPRGGVILYIYTHRNQYHTHPPLINDSPMSWNLIRTHIPGGEIIHIHMYIRISALSFVGNKLLPFRSAQIIHTKLIYIMNDEQKWDAQYILYYIAGYATGICIKTVKYVLGKSFIRICLCLNDSNEYCSMTTICISTDRLQPTEHSICISSDICF